MRVLMVEPHGRSGIHVALKRWAFTAVEDP
jgi:hypothetical protein